MKSPSTSTDSSNTSAFHRLPGVALFLGIALAAGVAHAQALASAPPLVPHRHFPAHLPDPSKVIQATPLVPDGTSFSQELSGAEFGAFTSQFKAIGPAPIGGSTSQTNSGRISAIAVDPTNNSVIYIAAAGGGVWKTTNGGTSWTVLTDNLPDLAMGALAIDPSNPSVIYAGSGEANFSGDSRYGAGLYKSTNGGSTWTVYTGPSNAFFGVCISRIVVDPVTPSNVYLTTAYGSNGPGSSYGVFKSTNGGVAWTRVFQTSQDDPFTDLAIDPTHPATLYAACGNIFGSSGNGIYKTTNSGTTWTLLTGFPNGTQSGNAVGRIGLALAPSNPQVLYADFSSNGAVGSFGSLAGFYRSANGGTTWTKRPLSTDGTGATGVPNFLGTQGWYDNTIVVSPTNANEVFAAGQVNYNATQAGEYIAINGSYDGGSTWTDYTYGTNFNGPHTDHHALAFTHDGAKLLDGNDGGIWRCENPNTSQDMSTITWTDLNTNLNITQFTGIALHPTSKTVAYGGSQDNGTEKYTGSLSWTQVRGGDGGFTRVDQSNPNTVYHEYYGISLERSDNGGSSWTYIAGTTGINPNDPVIDDGDDPAAFYVPYILDPANQSRILYGTNHLYESVDKGAHFTAIGSPGTAGFNPSGDNVIAIGAQGNTIYVSVGSVICRTTNDGATWTSLAQPGNGGVSDIYVNPASPTDVTVALPNFTGGRIYRSTNGGGNWTDISGNLPLEPFNAVKIDPTAGTLFAGADDGVYFSTNSGTSWTRATMPRVQVVDLAISKGAGLVAAGTHGRGVYESPLSGTVAKPVINSPTTATGQVGVAFSYQITATNNPTSFLAGGLPPGIGLNKTTGLISGKTTAAGTYTVHLTATNAGGSGTATLTLTINPAKSVITSAKTAGGTVGVAFNYQITATNNPTSFLAGGLPPGIGLNKTTGLISGKTTAAGTYTVHLTATNAGGSGTAALTLTIKAAP